MESDSDYYSALALVAVHSGIAFGDALLAQVGKSALRNENHAQSADLIEKECKSRGLNREGLAQLRRLLKAKTSISYGSDRVTEEFSTALSVAAGRFEAWFYKTVEELK
jgi:hypothetical protein